MTDGAREHWGGGPIYERYMGRWSRPAARVFLHWLAAPAHQRWLDVGCGTGALALAIADQANPEHGARYRSRAGICRLRPESIR